MTNFLKRTLSILIAMTLIFQYNIIKAFADDSGNGVSEFDNNFVKVRVKNEDGRFTIRTKEGNPVRQNDNNERLLFEEFQPETSFTTFRINGQDYIYGNDYGFLSLGGYFTNAPQISVDGMSNSSTWRVGDVEITQYLELIDDPENDNAGNVKIRYEATNRGSSNAEVGSRILLDTMIGSNDGAPVVLGTDTNPVIMEREITGEEIPLYYRSMDDFFAPNIMAYGFLEGWGNTRPDKMIVGHYEGLSTTKWDYSINPTLNFTDNSNQYGAADSSIALYWNPATLGPGETKIFETYYGVGSVNVAAQEANFGVNLVSPEKLTVNEEKTDYEDGSFNIAVEIDNTLEGLEDINDMQVSLILGEGLEVAPGELTYRHFDTITPNQVRTMTFKVKASPQSSYKLLKYRVDITTENISDPISYNNYILAPGLKGAPPEMQYQSISPSNVYFEGEKVFSINGTGFDFYTDKDNWNMYLESSITGVRTQIAREDITVTSDNQITVNHSESLELGEYKVVIENTAFGTETVLPHTLTASNDNKYIAKSYGLMAIVKRVDVADNAAQDFSYYIEMLQDEAALESLKQNISSSNESMKNSSTGSIYQLLLTVRGDILETNNGGNKRYSIDTGTVPAILNGVIQYNGQPIIIDESSTTGIALQGNGDLKLKGGFKFWKWEFEINLDNGTDYSLNPISSEDVKSVYADNRGAFIEENIDYVYVREPIHAQNAVLIDFTGMGKMAKYMGGFLIQIDNVALQEKAVSFGGTMALTFLPSDSDDPFAFGVGIDEILYGQNNQGNTEFKGINLTTLIRIPANMIGGILENTGSAKLTINTIDKVYSISSTMEIKTIECTGLLTIMFNEDNKPVLDDLEFAASVPKIPVFPPTLYLNKIGGGINDLYGTITGDVTAPPLKVVLLAGIELISERMFTGDVRIEVSKLMLTIKGNLQLEPISSTVIRNAYIEARWVDPVYISLGAELDILDIVVGNINAYVSSSWFEGNASARLKIPDRISLVGGMEFGSVNMGVNSEKMYGDVGINVWTPFGSEWIGVGVAYYWDGGLKRADAADGFYEKKGLYEDTITLDDGSPIKMAVGTNINKLGDSTNTAKYASLSDNYDRPALYATADETQHFFNVYNQEIAVFQIKYDGSQPDSVVLYRPNGVEYPLVSPTGEKAYIIKEGVDGQQNELSIFIPNPDNGTWKLNVDTPVQSTFLEIQAVPELNSVSASKNGDTAIDVSWNASNADESLVNISLVEASNTNDAGILIATDIQASLGSYTVNVPGFIVDGDYVVRVELKEGDYGYEVGYSSSMSITNPNSPSQVNNNIQLELLGNGLLGVEFDNVIDPDVVGYYIEVFTASGEKIADAGEYYVEQGTTQATVGGTYRTNDIDANGNPIVSEYGLDPGETYKVGITTLKEDSGMQLLSTTTYSNTIFLPVPDPADITLSLDNTFTAGVDEDGSSIVIIKDNNAIIDFSSDQNVSTTVMVNDSVYTTFNGSEKRITFPVEDGRYSVEVTCENTGKDVSSETITFIVDTTPPVLLIESPQESIQSAVGQVLVSGVSEPEAQLFVNGALVPMDKDGKFHTMVTVSNALRKTILVEARDQADNVASFEKDILNADAKDIVEVFIRPEVVNMRTGTTQSFSLVGLDENRNEITLENSMVTWSLMNGSTIADVSQEGLLTAYKTGEVVLVGSYYVSDSYAFEDAMTINVVDNDDLNGLVSVKIKPEYKGLRTGRTANLKLVGLDSEGNEIKLDPNLVSWSISRGSSNASINSNGVLYTKRSGSITVRGTFAFTSVDVFEATRDINLSESSANDDITLELQNILNNIIAREKDIIVLAMRNIVADMDNDIQASNELNLRVPTGAVSQEDAILVAKIKADSQVEQQASNQSLRSVTSLYEIEFAQSSRTLNKPVELKFKVDSQSVSNIENVGVYYYNERYGKWEYIGGEVVGDEVIIEVDHFSKYAVFERDQSLNMIDIEGIWSEEYIKKLASLEIVNGVDIDGLKYYEPTRPVTRIELAIMVSRSMMGEETEGENPPFDDWNDVPEWGKTHSKIAYDNGWINGKANGDSLLFSANENATRAEVATIIGRLIDIENPSEINFTDQGEIPSWARDQVAKLVGEGILAGYPDGSFKPNSYITREEVAKMLSVLIEINNKNN